ncbi:Uncharacterised protein [uncultured archaeon]|nr:Uncharacterised protein [uncultured archaeon]
MKRGLIFLATIIFVFGILAVSAIEPSYCCERLKNNGPFCQNAPLTECDPAYKAVPTSCEATSYCKLGCCNIINQGECMQNTPLATCGNSTDEGINFIADNPTCDVDQCKLGCCLMGDQASFVTQTKCNKLSAAYGLEINFRSDITNELECLVTGTALVKGACVFEKQFTRTCKMMTQKDCKEMEANEENQNVKFYQDHLCSDPELGTECAPSEKTMLVEGKDEVYFADTCGNAANIYDASKINDMSYWKNIVKKEASCSLDNKIPSQCGNCNYVEGTIGKEFTRKDFKAGTTPPVYGDYMCKDLSCLYDNNGDGIQEKYLHGESWCAHGVYIKATPTESQVQRSIGIAPIIIENGFIRGMKIDTEKQIWTRDTKSYPELEPSLETANLPGSRYFRLVCFNGEVTVEPCADFRQDVCIESMTVNDQTAASAGKMPSASERESLNNLQNFAGYNFDGFRNAACRPNRWQDCSQQKTEVDCVNIEQRDCRWADVGGDEATKHICLPLYPPGLKFWGEDTSETSGVTTSENTGMAEGAAAGVNNDAATICGVATGSCSITYEMGTAGKGGSSGFDVFNKENWMHSADAAHVKSGKPCFSSAWEDNKQLYSLNLGDCGQKNNYLGFLGSSKFADVEKSKLSKWN